MNSIKTLLDYISHQKCFKRRQYESNKSSDKLCLPVYRNLILTMNPDTLHAEIYWLDLITQLNVLEDLYITRFIDRLIYYFLIILS